MIHGEIETYPVSFEAILRTEKAVLALFLAGRALQGTGLVLAVDAQTLSRHLSSLAFRTRSWGFATLRTVEDSLGILARLYRALWLSEVLTAMC